MDGPSDKELPPAGDSAPQPDSEEQSATSVVTIGFYISLAVCLLGGFTGRDGMSMTGFAAVVGILCVLIRTGDLLFNRRYVAALATLLLGVLAVAAVTLVAFSHWAERWFTLW